MLVIDFGQLGDVVLSLPALRAVRERFPQARVTVAVGKSCAAVVELSGYADRVWPVDRVALRDGAKALAVFKIARLVKEVRGAQFDFVIDLHSLSETNILGYLSGAPYRLYARRPGRSLDFLSNFRPRPVVESDPRTTHAVERYLEVLAPLGIEAATRVPKLKTREADDQAIDAMLKRAKLPKDAPLVGMFPGAGHPSRRWPLHRFAEAAERLVRNDGVRVVVFAGPEEQSLVKEMRRVFPASTLIFDRLTIPQLAAMLARLSVLVSNDTGPMHIAAAVGTSVTLLLDKRAPSSYAPVEGRHQIIHHKLIDELSVDEVYEATRALLARSRTAALFAN